MPEENRFLIFVRKISSNMIIPSIHKTLRELSDLVAQLTNEEYSNPCHELSGATIGEHTRHIVEMFQCLQNQYENRVVNYDQRKRDYVIQTDVLFAQQAIETVLMNLNKPNINLELQQVVDGQEIRIQSNYHRELLYNLEHCIHHQALIKVAVLQLDHLNVDANFGVARSTIEYRKQCAQ